MFVNTKMDEGPCPKIHTEQLKQAFEDHGDPYMYDSVIEKDFTARLNEADRIIKVSPLRLPSLHCTFTSTSLLQRARARVEDDKVDEEINPDINPDIIRIHGEMSRIIQDAERAGENGEIDRAQDLILNRLEDATREKQAVMVR